MKKMPKPVVFVIGASGHIGSATVATLSAKYADRLEIRAGVRNPDKADKLKALPNITIVQATMGEKDQLSKTFAGVDVLYIVTADAENRAELAITTAESAKSAGVKHIAVVSIPTAILTNTIFGRQFNKLETEITALGVPYTIIRLPFFMENILMHKPTMVAQQCIFNPVDPEKSFLAITVEDAGKASAAILADPEKHVNKTYYIVDCFISMGGVAKAFSDLLDGKEIKYIHMSYEDARKRYLGFGIPDMRIDGLLELNQLIDEGSPTVTEADMSLFSQITGEQPADLKTWVAKNTTGL